MYAILSLSGWWSSVSQRSLPFVCEKEGADYASAQGKVEFADGVDIATFQVQIYNDWLYEDPSEKLTIQLIQAEGGAVIDSGAAQDREVMRKKENQ